MFVTLIIVNCNNELCEIDYLLKNVHNLIVVIMTHFKRIILTIVCWISQK